MEPLSGCSLCESIWLNVLHVEIVQQRYIDIFFFYIYVVKITTERVQNKIYQSFKPGVWH